MEATKRLLSKTERKVIRIMIAVAIVAIAVFGCIFYINDYYKASSTAQKAMLGNETVQVTEEDNYYHFTRKEDAAESKDTDIPGLGKGIIFYPGGKVEETAYAPLMLELAELGYDVYLVRMPAKLAIFGKNRADEVIAANPDMEGWIMMGHSLGGAMAANYSAAHDELIDGLVLLAAYSTKDLTEKEIDVYSFYGSEDKVLNMEKYEEYRSNLPEDAVEIVIDGGNHAYYGCYGEQKGDGVSDISRKEQIETILDNFVFAW